MSNIRALILDAGGVLVYPLHGNWMIPAKYKKILGDYAREIPSERWLKACQAEASILREDVLIPTISQEYELKLQFLRNVAARMNWLLSEDVLVALAQDFTHNPARHAWYSDSQKWLEYWHDRYRLGILSDTMPSFCTVLEHSPCGTCIDALVISTKLGVAKPDAKMYNTICAQLNVAPEDSLFVDDRAGNLEGALRCGLHAVQMCRDGLEHWNGPYVRNLEELNAYLEGLN